RPGVPGMAGGQAQTPAHVAAACGAGRGRVDHRRVSAAPAVSAAFGDYNAARGTMMLAQIRTVLFDLDGTLTVPLIDFDALRARLDLPAGVPLLHALAPLPEERRVHGMQVIHQAEIEAAHNAVANTGAIELVADLAARGIATAIVTRNSTDASRITLARLKLEVDALITRDFLPTKPAPAPVLEALRLLRGKPAGALMVGDYAD